EETASRIARRRATDEARDGIAAFLEKRPPAWLQ
nr:enoyl-CoA hydratase/isomerase family protein [Zoogloea sp.]